VFLSYATASAAGKTTVTLGVNNVLDRDPPVIYNQPSLNYDPTTYDFKGRYFYARMTHAF
jgi:iron complex outermembrane receptor protein